MTSDAFAAFRNMLHHATSFFEQNRGFVATQSIGKRKIPVPVVELALSLCQSFSIGTISTQTKNPSILSLLGIVYSNCLVHAAT